MKNRNYLILGNLLAIVLGLIFAMLTSENTIKGYYMYLDGIGWIIIVIPLILFYIIAFPDINQVSDIKIMSYKMRWLQNMTIYLGILGTFLGFTFLWGEIFEVGVKDIINSPVAILSRSLSIAFLTLVYALLISFSFYVLAFFVKENSDIPTKESGKRIFTNIIVIAVNIIVYLLPLTLGSSSSGIVEFKAMGLNNKYIFLLFFGVIVFYHFQPNSSIFMLIKNLFCDCKESIDSVKGQLKAINSTKRFIMGICLIAFIFIPTAIFSTLSYVISDSTQIFGLITSGTQIFLWGFILIVILTTLEGKYNYKLFQHEGSIIEDRLFLPKYVALPTILYYLMVVILFILFNILF